MCGVCTHMPHMHMCGPLCVLCVPMRLCTHVCTRTHSNRGPQLLPALSLGRKSRVAGHGAGGSACHSPQPLPAWPWLAVQVPTLQGTTAQAATLWGHPSHKASSHGHHGPGWPCARLLDRAFLAVSLAPLQPRAPRAAGPVTPASLPRARPPPRAAAGHRAGRLWAHSQGLQPARAWPRAAFGGVTHRGRPGPCPYVSGQRHWAHSSLNFPPGNGGDRAGGPRPRAPSLALPIPARARRHKVTPGTRRADARPRRWALRRRSPALSACEAELGGGVGEQLADGLPSEPGSWEGTCWPCPGPHAPPGQGAAGGEGAGHLPSELTLTGGG